MKMTTNDIRNAARACLGVAATRAPQHAKAIEAMGLRISTRMTRAAGTASYRHNEITLSLPFFADPSNFQKHLNNTVTHEAAHLIVGAFGRQGKPHGSQWKGVHKTLGGTASRTHTMMLADGYATRKRALKVDVPCSKCGKPMQLGPTRAKRARLGLAVYRHAKC